jgi:hypothetical protein
LFLISQEETVHWVATPDTQISSEYSGTEELGRAGFVTHVSAVFFETYPILLRVKIPVTSQVAV